MKLAFQLAYKNLIGAGLRTWLNVGVLAFCFIIIVFFNGIYSGWNNQAKSDSIKWEYGFGELRHPEFNPLDPFSIADGHGPIPEVTDAVPIFLQQASIFPDNRMISILLKGIPVDQDLLEIPSYKLDNDSDELQGLIGMKMAKASGLKIGDEVIIRWRDSNGAFDARPIKIAHVFDTSVPTVDAGQVWISLEKLHELTGYDNHASYLVAGKKFNPESDSSDWTWLSQQSLLQSITDLINSKRAGGAFMYIFLLGIALLALFDTQVLAIFRRQREIGTYIALGMTRWQVLKIFTVEGAMYSLFASIIGTLIGFPLMYFLNQVGIPMPMGDQNLGVAMTDRMYPSYGLALFIGTILLLVVSATLVSFLPSRKIVHMDPVDALKGKLQ